MNELRVEVMMMKKGIAIVAVVIGAAVLGSIFIPKSKLSYNGYFIYEK